MTSPLRLALFSICAFSASLHAEDTSAPKDDWTDPDTGHRIVRLSRVPGNNHVFYFHQNPFTAEGDRMAFVHSEEGHGSQIYTVDLKTFDCRPASEGYFHGGPFFQVVAPKSHRVFFVDGAKVCAADLDTGKTSVITTLPQGWTYGRGLSINADETLLAGCASVGEREVVANGHFANKSTMMEAVWGAKLPAVLYTIDLKTGKTSEILKGTDWYGHVQFSPTDPGLLMFCHEGPWEKVERIWTIRTDGSGLRSMCPPGQEKELVGHEFWDPGGAFILYDRPRPHANAVAATRIDSLAQTVWPLECPNDWNVHYNVSADGKFFAGDGCANQPGHVGNPQQWIRVITKTPEGKLHEERLVDLGAHHYMLEPNVHITPDGHWIVYQAKLGATSEVYAVEVPAAIEP